MGQHVWKKRLSQLVAASPLVVILASILLGILFWGGFNTALEMTNTETFCISCHEMRDNVYKEYRKTIHYQNRTGVRATCPDCHVPRDWIHKVVRKIAATNELYHWMAGSINTREKFVAKRYTLAQHVWAGMKRTDSRECRNCHDFEAMQLAPGTPAKEDRHWRANMEGKTCIDCHKGIAHQLPEEFLEIEHARLEKEKVPCYQCHVDMQRPPDDDWDDE
ncbi:Cytochrome c-type protein NapC [hydrothermal vent metagenome]|uniref:Cytochrome c-type protein NapC n=1 Tax=hydrothermal vent metagenome TaxID=652676 RepID=A0A3B0Z253_9ZZZZ